MLNVALPKGRLGEQVYEAFARAGFPCPSIREDSRKLIFTNEAADVSYFWVKPSDVAIYTDIKGMPYDMQTLFVKGR